MVMNDCQVRIKAPNARSRISMLSGGNAQRVLIANGLRQASTYYYARTRPGVDWVRAVRLSI